MGPLPGRALRALRGHWMDGSCHGAVDGHAWLHLTSKVLLKWGSCENSFQAQAHQEQQEAHALLTWPSASCPGGVVLGAGPNKRKPEVVGRAWAQAQDPRRLQALAQGLRKAGACKLKCCCVSVKFAQPLSPGRLPTPGPGPQGPLWPLDGRVLSWRSGWPCLHILNQ